MSKHTPFPISPRAELLPGPRSGPASPPLQGEWNVVSRQKRSASTSHHAPPNHASAGLPGTSTRQISLANDTEIARLKQRVDDLETCLAEASESAGKAWKGGRLKNLERQYHIEEVRRLQEERKNVTLDYQRARVLATKKTTAFITTIDLHYTTAAQAVILAKEFLEDYGASETHPMQFITGRGNRSIGHKPVLGPAVYKALVDDGWDVSTIDAGLTVRGRVRL
ncbi:hypothetical protein BGW80DRAFT_1174339 [Lactifluus volemus]|nr:hypothetical protein BGW80DRAFT_1174339 [Lactifluus volemus]